MAAKTKKASSTGNGTKKKDHPLMVLHQKLVALKPQMAKQTAKGINIDHQIGATIALAKGSSRLQQCTIASLTDAIYMANREGLNLHPGLKHGYLVPFKRNKKIDGQWHSWHEAVLIRDFRFFIAKAVATQMVRDVDVFMVRAGDTFVNKKKFIGGRNESVLEWSPAPESSRGDITHAVVVFTMPDGSSKYRVMDRARIDAIRKSAPSARGDSSPWDDHFEEMAAKTVVKWGFKLIPQNIEFAEMLAADNKAEGYDEPGADYREGEVIDVEAIVDDVESDEPLNQQAIEHEPPPPDDELSMSQQWADEVERIGR